MTTTEMQTNADVLLALSRELQSTLDPTPHSCWDYAFSLFLRAAHLWNGHAVRYTEGWVVIVKPSLTGLIEHAWIALDGKIIELMPALLGQRITYVAGCSFSVAEAETFGDRVPPFGAALSSYRSAGLASLEKAKRRGLPIVMLGRDD